MKRIASIQDISCLGRCSLTVALPVISAMGVECAIVPTAVLSTHTMFPHFTCKDLTDQILPIAHHWKEQELHLDAIYTGYLASAEQIEDVCTFFDEMQSEDTLIFVDPAMADHGKLYPAFDDDFPKAMAKVVSRAHVAVPNLTEICLLTDTPYREDFTESELWDLLKQVAALGAEKVVLTGASFSPDRLGVMAYDSKTGERFTYYNHRVPVSFHGTGDIFAATTVGAMTHGYPLEDALKLAVDFTLDCIRATQADPNATWYGVEFEKALPLLIERMK